MGHVFYAARVPPRRRAALPHIENGRLVLRVAGLEHAERVSLWTHLTLPLEREFARVDDGWLLEQRVPDLDRLEYLLEVTDGDGHTTMGPDPSNPRRVPTAFGDHSWVPLPGYHQPSWLTVRGVPHHHEWWGMSDTPIGDVEAQVWSPADSAPGDDLPMLVAHDGPEMAALAGLTQYAGALIARGRLPRLRVVLLAPGHERDGRYSANDAYADQLVRTIEILSRRWHSSAPPIALGASLGGLAALHAQWRHPGLFGGMWLASGSYFTPGTDPHMHDFAHWDRITGFTAAVTGRRDETGPVGLGEIAVVCGTGEENLANNALVLESLRRRGVPATWGCVRDGHNYSCWRDLLDPHLTELVHRTWG